jgi:hypothetical protein
MEYLKHEQLNTGNRTKGNFFLSISTVILLILIMHIQPLCSTELNARKVKAFHMLMHHRSRYSDWLRAGQPSGQISVKNFHFSMSLRPVLGPTRPLLQSVPMALSRGEKQLGREADHSPETSAEVKYTRI